MFEYLLTLSDARSGSIWGERQGSLSSRVIRDCQRQPRGRGGWATWQQIRDQYIRSRDGLGQSEASVTWAGRGGEDWEGSWQGDQCSVSWAEMGEGRCCEDNELKIVNLLNREILTMSLNWPWLVTKGNEDMRREALMEFHFLSGSQPPVIL